MSRKDPGLSGLLLDRVEHHAHRIALVHGDVRWRYADLRTEVEQIRARVAQSGFRNGERVLLWLENSPRFVAAWIAILALGGVAVPVHARTPLAEVSRLTSELSATGLVVSSATLGAWEAAEHSIAEGDRSPSGLASHVHTCALPVDRLRFIVRPDRIDLYGFRGEVQAADAALAQIIHTSGSTGRPKGVMLSHGNLIANANAVCASLGLKADDSTIGLLPFSFSYGNSVLLTHLLAGACVVIENSPYPQAILERMRTEQVTGLSGVTSTFSMLLQRCTQAPLALPALRTVTHAGGTLPAALLARMRAAFTNARLFLMYGQTEASPRLTCLAPEDLDRKPGSVGRAIDGVSLRIVREDGQPAAIGELGEVLASGPNIMQGYWGDPAASELAVRDGWLHTGDLGRLDGEGYLTLAGRNDEMIKSGEYRIGPAEIEAALLEHPGVSEAAVAGIDDAMLGQAVCAFVVLAPGSGVRVHELRAHCAHRLAPYKIPRRIDVVASVPRTASGKIKRQALRDLAALVPDPEMVAQR